MKLKIPKGTPVVAWRRHSHPDFNAGPESKITTVDWVGNRYHQSSVLPNTWIVWLDQSTEWWFFEVKKALVHVY